jgi:hypothetical protein
VQAAGGSRQQLPRESWVQPPSGRPQALMLPRGSQGASNCTITIDHAPFAPNAYKSHVIPSTCPDSQPPGAQQRLAATCGANS